MKYIVKPLDKIRPLLLPALGWLLLVSALWGLDLLSKFDEKQKLGYALNDFRLIAEQITSGLAALMMIGFAYFWFEHSHKFSSSKGTLLVAHIIGFFIFALGHYLLMVIFRFVFYSFYGETYVNDAFFFNFLVELKKDVKIYIGVILILYFYQHFRTDNKPSTDKTRIMVMTGSGQAIIDIVDIEYLAASKNYVSYHTQQQEYLVRDTLTNSLSKLPEKYFIRCQRSYAVNIRHIASIEKISTKKFVLTISGTKIPLSQSYYEPLIKRLAP